MKTLNQAQLKELLHYDPETGFFRWRVTHWGKVEGEIAGGDDGKGYVRINLLGRKRPAHHLAYLYMTGESVTNQIDHINGVKSDNRWANLRHVTAIENMRNRKLPSTNKSGAMGVLLHSHGRWQARIKIDHKYKHLGYFATKEEAIAERMKAESEIGFHKNHGRLVTAN